MEIQGKLVEGRFLARDNRFRVAVEVEGRRVAAHLANSGRLGELLVPGRQVALVERGGTHRKTTHDLSAVRVDGIWVSLDARLPNDLVAEALEISTLAPLAGYASVQREVLFGGSRLDFLLEGAGRQPCLVEVKSVTLIVDGWACFPDAVTLRGRRHLLELASAVDQGYRAVVLFVVQRPDAVGFRPHDESDPGFGQTLREVVGRGVEVNAYACSVEPGRAMIKHPLQVRIDARPGAMEN